MFLSIYLCSARVPVVDRYKYLSRGKWMTNVCDRWAKNKTDTLHAAWFNGAGYETWENVRISIHTIYTYMYISLSLSIYIYICIYKYYIYNI